MESSPVSPEKDTKKKSHRKELGVVAVEAPEQKARRRAPEANLLHSSQPERIGQVLMAAESKPAKEPSATKPEKAAELSERPSPRQVETMSRVELLILSEKIIVDGSNLRQIYETHLVGERGLRRLIIEHLRGGDIKKALRQEIVEREIDFERDPALRDMAISIPKIIRASKGDRTELNKLLAQASMQLAGTSEEVAFFKARADYEATLFEQHQKQRKAIERAFIIIILILLGSILWLALRRT